MKKCYLIMTTCLITAMFVNSVDLIADDNVTAREKLTQVKAFVANYAADAQLVTVTTEADVELDGKAHQWIYFFTSDTKQQVYEIWYDDGTISRHTPLSHWDDFRVRLDFPALPEDWIDSEDAIAVAEANGGSDFRAAQGNHYAIGMSLMPPFVWINNAVDVWAISYRSNDKYFDILVNAETGAVYEIQRSTAREYFTDVEAAAVAVAADAQLIRVFGGDIDLQGTTEGWVYLYRSPSQQPLIELEVKGGGIIQTPENATPNPNDFQYLQPLPDNWLDSDEAVAQAEAEGGETFRGNQEIWFIAAELVNPNEEPTKWEVNYEVQGEWRRYDIEGLQPVTAREYLSEIADSAAAVAADAQLIKVWAHQINLDGKTGEWRYLFQSESQQTLFEFVCEGGTVVRSSEVTSQDPSVYLGVNPLPDNWIDSDFALELAENGGGETYRQNQTEYQIVASLACHWGDPAQWAFDYQIIGDARVFIVNGVLPNLTARELLSDVHKAAKDYVPEAELIYLRSDDVNPDGTSTTWKYVYDWSARQVLYEFWAIGAQAMQHEVTVTDEALHSGMIPLPLSWFDSDAALDYTEDNGGSRFRTDHADCNVDATLYVPTTSMSKISDSGTAARWTVHYASADANQTYTWNAGNFSYDWTAQSSGVTPPLRSVDAVSDLVCWASGNDGTVIRTTDRGETWLDASSGLNPETFYSIAGIDALTALIAAWESASAGAVIFRTDDGGSTWTNVYSLNGGFVNGVIMFSETDGIAYGDPYDGEWLFLQTTDGGSSWETMENAPQQQDGDVGGTAFWLNASVGWIGTNMPWAYRTTDGGTTWTRVDVPGLSKVQKLACDNNGNILVSSGFFNQDTTEAFMRSTDNGDTWEGLHPPKDGFINHITFYNNRFWIVMDNTVYKTTTLGDTWTAEAMAYDGLRSLSFAENNPYIYGWAVGGSGTVLHYSFDTTPVLPEISDGPPEHFVLYQNYPNPFNPETTIRYTLPSKSDVIIQIFNLLGKSVFSIEKQGCKAGTHRFRWDGRDDHHRSVESGLYLYRITTAFGTESLKMMLLK